MSSPGKMQQNAFNLMREPANIGFLSIIMVSIIIMILSAFSKTPGVLLPPTFLRRCPLDYTGPPHVCAADTDKDFVPDVDIDPGSCIYHKIDGKYCRADNCRYDFNPSQLDTDDDGIGDACDLDDDGDGVPDTIDKCPLVPPPWDVRHPDKDDDGIGDECDNCPNIPNYDQSDLDNDKIGDVCDADIDGDGFTNYKYLAQCVIAHTGCDKVDESENIDKCPFKWSKLNTDENNDGIGDVCDLCPIERSMGDDSNNCDPCKCTDMKYCEDQDHDGVKDHLDNCKTISNTLQIDTDHDGIGDACDHDDDNDNFDDELDDCPLVPGRTSNASLFRGTMCMDDFDGDGVVDEHDAFYNDKYRSEDRIVWCRNDLSKVISKYEIGTFDNFTGMSYNGLDHIIVAEGFLQRVSKLLYKALRWKGIISYRGSPLYGPGTNTKIKFSLMRSSSRRFIMVTLLVYPNWLDIIVDMDASRKAIELVLEQRAYNDFRGHDFSYEFSYIPKYRYLNFQLGFVWANQTIFNTGWIEVENPPPLFKPAIMLHNFAGTINYNWREMLDPTPMLKLMSPEYTITF